jgi:hypothetical protein
VAEFLSFSSSDFARHSKKNATADERMCGPSREDIS